MIKIKFNNEDKFREVEFSRTEHTVTLKGITEINTSGFNTYRLTGQQLGDFSDFITVYRQGENYIEYSNDGSVYEEPIKPIEQEITKEEKYQNLVVSLIREKYSINDELAILRQRDEKPQEYQEYYAYCEECKAKAKAEIEI